MPNLLKVYRALAPRFAAPLAFAWLLAGLIGGLHHHDGAARGHDSCAVCSAGHAPAIAATPAPAANAPCMISAAAPSPDEIRIARASARLVSSRAPPPA